MSTDGFQNPRSSGRGAVNVSPFSLTLIGSVVAVLFIAGIMKLVLWIVGGGK